MIDEAQGDLLAPADASGQPTEDQGGDMEDDVEEEHEVLRKSPDPMTPTPAEVEDHRRAGHIPYRSWCIWCTFSRGLGIPNRHGGDQDRHAIPVVSLEYLYLTKGRWRAGRG